MTARQSRFLGMNNLLPESQLGTREGRFLRNAVNVNFTGAGTVKTREGFTQSIVGNDCHSFAGFDDQAFYVDGVSMYRVTGTYDAMSTTVLRSDMAADQPVSYARAGGSIYYSNGLVFGKVDADGVDTPHAIETPNSTLTITTSAGGGLHEGIYQFCYAFVGADGSHSGATQPTAITVGSNGIVFLSGFAPLPANAVSYALFMTPVNGDLFYLVDVTATPVTSVPLFDDGGMRCATRFLDPLPAGVVVREYGGRLLSAYDNILFYSEHYQYGLYNPLRNFIPFPEPITIVEPCVNGVYVVADQAYWLAGPDIAVAEVNPCHWKRAAFGTGITLPDEKVGWYADNGFIVADKNGEATNFQEKAVATEPAAMGASLFREQDGMRQLLTSLAAPGSSVAVAKSFMEAEVVRKETFL